MAALLQHVGAAAPGLAPPRSDEAPALAGAKGFKGNRTAGSGDCASKAFATLQARAAMAGVQVDPIGSDDGRQVFIVSRWNLTRQCDTLDEHLTRQCDTLDELRELLQRMGVAV